MSARVKSDLWVAAQVRLCDRLTIPAVVVRKGDPDSGAVLVRVEDAQRKVVVWTQVTTADGERAWKRFGEPAYTTREAWISFVSSRRLRQYR